jgi:hypothetical protein
MSIIISQLRVARAINPGIGLKTTLRVAEQ